MKARGGLLFLQRFLMKAYLSHFLFTMTKHASTFMRKSGLLFKYTKKKCTTSEFHSTTVSQVFSCVLREKWEQRRTKFHRWCLSGKKSRKAKVHTPFSSTFAQIQCHSMATNDGCSCCVVTLSQCWLQRY